MNFIEYPDLDFLNIRLAASIASQLSAFIRRDGRATLCVAGGSTPSGVYDILSGVDIDWAAVTILLTDERWVPEGSERSNTTLLKEHLLKGRAAKAKYVSLYRSDCASPEAALPQIEHDLKSVLPISVALLGMGGDMHTASLFPHTPGLELALSNDAPVVMAMHPSNAIEPRLTLTAAVFRKAFHIHVMITGSQKRTALEQAVTLPPLEAPIRIVLDQADVHWSE